MMAKGSSFPFCFLPVLPLPIGCLAAMAAGAIPLPCRLFFIGKKYPTPGLHPLAGTAMEQSIDHQFSVARHSNNSLPYQGSNHGRSVDFILKKC